MEAAANTQKPVVMCFSGLDPSGGAGIQADIETLFSVGCHCAPIVTALTTQNTVNAMAMVSTDATMLIQQARAVLEDMPVQAIKLGLLGSVETIEVIHTLLTDYSSIPVVLDPVASAGGGYNFSGKEVRRALLDLLVPLTTLITPNTDEARELAPAADNLDACANELMDFGCENVLITGTHAQSESVINRFYGRHQQDSQFNWPRLPCSYHGSGCTLSAAISGYLAHRVPLRDAVEQAQRFTWEALNGGFRLGFGQHLPDRGYWHERKS